MVKIILLVLFLSGCGIHTQEKHFCWDRGYMYSHPGYCRDGKTYIRIERLKYLEAKKGIKE